MSAHIHKLFSRAGAAVISLFLSVALPAAAQTTPAFVSNPVAIPHTGSFGNIWQSAVSTRGDWIAYDFKTDSLYEFPANGGPEIVIAASGVIAGGFNNSGIVIDPRNNNIYIDDNYNNGLLIFPYDTATQSWDLGFHQVATSLAGNLGGSCGNYFQSAGLAINSSGLMAVATENGCGVGIFTVPLDPSGNFGTAVPIVSNMNKRAKTLAIDNAGNIYYSEDISPAGAMYIPAGVNNLNGETTVARIDINQGPKSNVQGVTLGAAGNVYIADGTVGTYMVPVVNGVPNPAAAVAISPVPAAGGPAIDPARGTLFYQIGTYGSITDIVKIYLNRTEFGSSVVGATTPAAATANFIFSSAGKPYSFLFQQDGVTSPFTTGDLSGCGITFTTTTTTDPTSGKTTTTVTENSTSYAANATCSIGLNFNPTLVGKSTATLTMLDATGKVLSTSLLHGSGSGSVDIGLPGTETAVGKGFKTPSQIAVDYAGNTYIADSGLGKVYQYAAGGSSTSTPVSLGTGLVAPTGVAVDGIGDVFIADSGNVYEIPYGPTGLVAASQVTLKTGLGAGVILAADGIGDVYAADPVNQRYITLRTNLASIQETDYSGYTQLTAIAADGMGDVYLANGPNLIEITSSGTQTLTNTLANATSLAVDHSGAVYVTSPTQTTRIPNVGGKLVPTSQVAIAPAATKPVSVAVDANGNAYVADSAAEDIDALGFNVTLNFGKQANATASSTGSATLFNSGNLPLTITGFGSTADFSVTTSNCVGTALAVGASCNATVTFNPGPGDQGALSAQLAIKGNEINLPSGINVIGTGVTLANSTTTVTVNKPTVTNAPVVVTVTPATGTSPVPTGNVTVTVTGLAAGSTPITSTQPLINGTATFNELTLQAATLTFTANYIGDRVYGRSTATVSSPVTAGTVTLVQPAASTVPVYVLAAGAGAQEPYDGSQLPFYYNYPVSVVAANNAPLVGIPVLNASTGALLSNNYGMVSYQVAGGASACVGSSSTINVNADGTAPLPASCLAINTSNTQIPDITTSYTITPVYSGPNYGSVTGTPITLIAIRSPMVLISSSTTTLPVPSGSTASATLTVTSLLGYGVTGVNGNLNNYSLPVEMGCDALPAHATCSFTYSTPDASDSNSTPVTPTAPATVKMTINTNVAVGTTTSQLTLKQAPRYFAAMFGLGFLGLTFSRRKTLRLRLLSVLLVSIFSSAVLGLSACSSANISANPVLTSPKGTYTITVTAKQAGSRQVPNPVSGGAPITVYGNGNQMSIPFTMNVTIQ